jgi:hypothetical protein
MIPLIPNGKSSNFFNCFFLRLRPPQCKQEDLQYLSHNEEAWQCIFRIKNCSVTSSVLLTLEQLSCYNCTLRLKDQDTTKLVDH